MSDRQREKKSVLSRLLSPFREKHRAPTPQQATESLVSHSRNLSAWGPSDTSSSDSANTVTSVLIPVSPQANSGHHAAVPAAVTISTATTMQPKNLEVQDDQVHYMTIGGLPTDMDMPETTHERTKAVGGTVYEGLKTVVEGLYDCSDMFLPLKAAAGVFLKIVETVETVGGNKQDLEDLKAKLEAIIAIVKKYHEHNAARAIDQRIKSFCEAIGVQIQAMKELQDHSLPTRIAEGNKDADTIMKAIRNISGLCDIFQIDTQLNIEGTTIKIQEIVVEILQRLNSGSIDKLNHEMISYKTRSSSYGDPTGCMPGTRVKILGDLDAWASDANSSKVYWMVGMAGTGKSTISHSFCEILDRKNLLGGSFFASRASDKTNNPRLIVPAIAYALARASPTLNSEIVKAIDNDPALAEPTYINMDEQFKKLVYNPIQSITPEMPMACKIIVIDAVDECVNLGVVSSLITLVLQLSSDLPLKIFIASRDETLIRNAFYPKNAPTLQYAFYLHEVEKNVVKDDITTYIKTSLAGVQKRHCLDQVSDGWPPPAEVSSLIERSGALFIYAATAIRFIDDDDYKYRLSIMIGENSTSKSNLQTAEIDDLYGRILQKACERRLPAELNQMRETLTTIIFLRNPLPIQGISSLLQGDERDISISLSRLKSLVHIPTDLHGPVAPFHASFLDFITDPTRCSRELSPSFSVLVPSEGHGMLALKCLEYMNHFLRRNICDVSSQSTKSWMKATNEPYSIRKIPEALKYSCLSWSSHLAQVPTLTSNLVGALRHFLHEHLLHWIECLSILGELQTGIKSLQIVTDVLSRFQETDYMECHQLQLLAIDARRMLQLSFECIRKHCSQVYWSALVWLPKKSLIRNVYATDVSQAPKVLCGLPDIWDSIEHIMQNCSEVCSVAFSQDGSLVVSGSSDKIVRIWNTTSGEVQAELKGHLGGVMSAAFSQDGSRVISGSDDNTFLIWNTRTGEVQAELKGQSVGAIAVAFSQDGSRVISGSDDNVLLIWNSITSEVQAELKGHTDWVMSAAFSQDGSRVVTGSDDKTVRIWNAVTGEVQVRLRGHTGRVRSVAFSQDCSLVGSGSSDKTVRLWNTATGKVQAELKGHTGPVMCVAFSQDGTRVVSGSSTSIVRIWNTTTGELQAELKGHTDWVTSVAFSHDGSRLVSGSYDKTVRIWNTTPGEVQAELPSRPNVLSSVAISQDDSSVASVFSDDTSSVWNKTTEKAQPELYGYTGTAKSFMVSQDGNRLVTESDDKTIRICNTITGKIQATLKGHTGRVMSAAFSRDGSRVVSGSEDTTVRIWSTTTGEQLRILLEDDIIRLHDSTRVYHRKNGRFNMVYPPRVESKGPGKFRLYSLTKSGSWVTHTMGQDCWIPYQYRDCVRLDLG